MNTFADQLENTANSLRDGNTVSQASKAVLTKMVEDNTNLSTTTKNKLTKAIADSTTTSGIASEIRRIDGETQEDVVGILKQPSAAHGKVVDTVLSTAGSSGSDGQAS